MVRLGILQGERRWWPVAILFLATGVPRLVLGTALIWWRPTVLSAMIGVVIGAVLRCCSASTPCGGRASPGEHSQDHSARPILREILNNSQALLAFLALMNVDVIIARNVLSEHDAGLYAGGLILTKAVLFLPQFVVIVAFPAMSTAHERRQALLRSLSFVVALGAVGTLVVFLLPQLALIFVGGKQYDEISDQLWMFAILGTILSLLQLLIYSVLARQGTKSVYLVWAALVVLLAVGLQMSTITALLTTVLVIDSALFTVLLTISLRRLRVPLPVKEPLAEPHL